MSADPNAKREDALTIGAMGHAAFKRILNLPYPTLAAYNGATMGGGVEVGLYHKYRTISKSPGGCDHYALPECFLGLVPGWGGTQLVTKLCGPEIAIELVISNPLNMNKMINSIKALEMGLATGCSHRRNSWMNPGAPRAHHCRRKKIERKAVDPKMSDELLPKTKAMIVGRVHSGALAPYRALELIKEQAFGRSMKDSRKRTKRWPT